MRHLLSILGLTLVILAVMSITPVMASNHKDGDSYKEPEVTKPVEAPPVMEEKHEEQPVSVAPPEAKVEMKKEVKCGPCVKTWIAKKKDYLRHMNSDMLDEQAINFMSGVCQIAILPFVDLTKPSNQGTSMLADAGGPRRIVESLADALMKKGYLIIPPPDSESVLDQYLEDQLMNTPEANSSELANNNMYFDVLPSRALNFISAQTPLLKSAGQALQERNSETFLSSADIVKLATKFDADCIIRGYVEEYALEHYTHGDLRTWLPPFIGAFSPEHRAYIKVTYYIYDGKSGQMVWNGSSMGENIAEWPTFASDQKLLRENETKTSHKVVRRVTPNWQDLIMNHPKWIQCDAWDMIGGCPEGAACTMENGEMGKEGTKESEEVMKPEVEQGTPWSQNPHRHGWHRTYN